MLKEQKTCSGKKYQMTNNLYKMCLLLKLTSTLETIYSVSLHIKQLYFVENLMSLVHTYTFSSQIGNGMALISLRATLQVRGRRGE